MAKDPAALLYIDKWLLATSEMKGVARAYYMDLILHQFDKGSLPSDIEELASLARVRASEYDLFKQTWEQVLKHKFEANENGRLENAFAKQIITGREQFKDKREHAGTIGAIVKVLKNDMCLDFNQIHVIKEVLMTMDIQQLEKHKDKQVLKQMVKLYINTNVNTNTDLNSLIKSDENFKNETGQETGMDNVRPIESIRHRHWPASSKECEDYFALKGSTSTAGASFFRKYEAQAWMISGNAIVKWKFKADEWISNPNKFGSTEPKKVLEITASDYDSIPQTSYGTI